MQEKMINCSRCGAKNATYQQIYPNGTIVEFDYQCGYQHNSLMTVGSKFLEEQMEILPEIYKLLISEDEDGKVWLPSFTNVPTKGLVYANGTSRDNWWWEAIKYKKLKVPEVKNHQKITEKINPKSMKKFEEMDFLSALEYIKIL